MFKKLRPFRIKFLAAYALIISAAFGSGFYLGGRNSAAVNASAAQSQSAQTNIQANTRATVFLLPPDPPDPTPPPPNPNPPPPPPPPPSGPAVPANATIIANIDQMPVGWQHCASPTCSGGQQSLTFCAACTPLYYFERQNQTAPALDGSSMQFEIGSGALYGDALISQKVSGNGAATHLLDDFYFYGDANSLHAQSLEFDLIQVSNGLKYNFGSQCAYVSGVWDVWNEKTQNWISTGIPCTRFSSNTWHHVQWLVERTGTSTKYLSLTIDGKTTPIPASVAVQPAVPTTWGSGVSVQAQLDESSSRIGYKVWFDRWRVALW